MITMFRLFNNLSIYYDLFLFRKKSCDRFGETDLPLDDIAAVFLLVTVLLTNVEKTSDLFCRIIHLFRVLICNDRFILGFPP